MKVEGFPYEITITAVYCPPRHNLKKEHFETFFQTLGPKLIAGGDYNSKHTLWGSRLTTSTKGRELSKVIQETNYSFLPTGTPTYWPTDGNKIPDLLDFFVTNGISSTYTDIRLNLGPFSNNSNIKHISNSQKTNTSLAHLKNKLGYLQTSNTRQSKSINKT
jgi:hypothetical protein